MLSADKTIKSTRETYSIASIMKNPWRYSYTLVCYFQLVMILPIKLYLLGDLKSVTVPAGTVISIEAPLRVIFN